MHDATLHLGDCLDVLPTLAPGAADAIVCDPPYGLEFMGKEWDRLGLWEKRNKSQDLTGKSSSPFLAAGVNKYVAGRDAQAWHEQWARAALSPVKPGGYLFAFGGTRTFHRLAVAIEDAGWEIRDCIMWIHGQGFPKAKSCLKPAFEPVIVARKPGPRVLPLGIDEARIATSESLKGSTVRNDIRGGRYGVGHRPNPGDIADYEQSPAGRWPANVAHDGSDEVLEAFAAFGERKKRGNKSPSLATAEAKNHGRTMNKGWGGHECGASCNYGDAGTAARFFFCSKASRRERWSIWKCNCKTVILPEWQRPDPSLSAPTDTTSHARAISGQGLAGECGSSTSSSGNWHTDHCRAGGKSTTPTATSRTTGSKTCVPSALQNTSVSTQDANYGTEYGGSLVACADSESPSLQSTGTSRAKGGPSTVDADPATSPASSEKSVCERCGGEWVRTSHPTVKPLALMEWLVKLACPPGGTVLDPFAGSGTTGVACVRAGRRFVGVEKNADYHAIAARRIEAERAASAELLIA